ncbi:MAG: ParA family protein [Christensenellaceae bacterium]|jgi:hypothetical protein
MKEVVFQKYVVCIGNYGSGKTEIALNIALKAAAAGKKTMLVDMDLINPYFKSSAQRARLEAAGVEVVAPVNANTMVEAMSLSGEIYLPFQRDDLEQVVFDVGGDANGSRVLGMLKEHFTKVKKQVEFLFIMNIGRPLQRNAEEIIHILREIEKSGSYQVTGLVNNTNLARETEVFFIHAGEKMAEEVSRKTGIPIKCTVIREDLAAAYTGKYPVLPIQIYMREDWFDLV